MLKRASQAERLQCLTQRQREAPRCPSPNAKAYLRFRVKLHGHWVEVVFSLFAAECSSGPGHWVGARITTFSFITPYLPYIQHAPSSHRAHRRHKVQKHAEAVPVTKEVAAVGPSASTDCDAAGGDKPAGTFDAACGERIDSECGLRSTLGGGLMQHLGVKAILPDICFRLVNSDGGELGTLSLALNSFVTVPQGERCLKLQLQSPLLASLPPPMIDMAMMVSSGVSSRPSSCSALSTHPVIDPTVYLLRDCNMNMLHQCWVTNGNAHSHCASRVYS